MFTQTASGIWVITVGLPRGVHVALGHESRAIERCVTHWIVSRAHSTPHFDDRQPRGHNKSPLCALASLPSSPRVSLKRPPLPGCPPWRHYQAAAHALILHGGGCCLEPPTRRGFFGSCAIHFATLYFSTPVLRIWGFVQCVLQSCLEVCL